MATASTQDSSPYNIFHDGEMRRDFVELINSNKKRIESALASKNFTRPSEEKFREKVLYYYNWDVDSYSNIIAMQPDLMPEIAVKDLKIVFVEGESDEVDPNLLYHYNQFIFNDDKASLTWLKGKQPALLGSLVKNFGFTKNNDVLKSVFEKTRFKNAFDVRELIFGASDDLLVLRPAMLRKIREIQYGNAVADGFSETVSGDFYYTLDKNITDIFQNKKNYKDADKSIAILLNELALSGITGSIDSFLKKESSYLKTLQNNNFFQQEKLRDYVENSYEMDESEISDLYFIRDADGYTNLRKEKSASSEILERIPSDQQVTVLDNKGDWWEIQTRSGKRGYVHKSKIGVR